jgi:hypothetical protein
VDPVSYFRVILIYEMAPTNLTQPVIYWANCPF